MGYLQSFENLRDDFSGVLQSVSISPTLVLHLLPIGICFQAIVHLTIFRLFCPWEQHCEFFIFDRVYDCVGYPLFLVTGKVVLVWLSYFPTFLLADFFLYVLTRFFNFFMFVIASKSDMWSLASSGLVTGKTLLPPHWTICSFCFRHCCSPKCISSEWQ